MTDIGDVGNDYRSVGFDYGFDRLAIRSADKLFYWTGAALIEVTDPDLGLAKDMVWSDGYYVTSDGQYIVATQLNDPTAVDPIKYGSAEEDPDMITGLLRFREEIYAFGRNTIQVFQNVGGNGFPFANVPGATIPYGCVSASAKCLVGGTFAFVGGARDEPLSVYVETGGNASRISTREIDDMLNAEGSPELIELEARVFGEERQLLVHLQDKTLGIALGTSTEGEQGAWFILNSGRLAPYRLRRAVWCYGKHIVGDRDSAQLGVLTEAPEHFGDGADWQFDTALMFNDGKAFLVNEVELFGQFPTVPNAVFLSMSRDAVVYSREVSRRMMGRRDERMRWTVGARCPTLAAMRFRGRGRYAFSRCEMTGEPLG
ncbi:packaged DNA stabilization protein [Novosphingobium sp. MMS21-SN21R]|nr:packaged DNA stabilization protein [Novosphingobium sp. MMS21-SN21R]MDT0507532.1 packaged DNA stabilization protein [Novosphingobium sp. MMS21-SN21R]